MKVLLLCKNLKLQVEDLPEKRVRKQRVISDEEEEDDYDSEEDEVSLT